MISHADWRRLCTLLLNFKTHILLFLTNILQINEINFKNHIFLIFGKRFETYVSLVMCYNVFHLILIFVEKKMSFEFFQLEKKFCLYMFKLYHATHFLTHTNYCFCYYLSSCYQTIPRVQFIFRTFFFKIQ